MVRAQRVAALALVLTLSVAGCARAVSGAAATAAVAPAASAISPSSPIPALPLSSGPLPSAFTPPASTTPSSAPVVSSAAPTPTVHWSLPTPSTAARKNNQFGNRIATVGQTYAITYADTQQTVLRFVVDSIKLDAKCENTDEPSNGHFLVISLRVQLGAVTSKEADDDGIGFTDSDWTAFDAKNVAQVGTSEIGGECLTTSSFPSTDDFESGKVVSGRVALDVSATKGTVVLMNTISGGWVYSYG